MFVSSFFRAGSFRFCPFSFTLRPLFHAFAFSFFCKFFVPSGIFSRSRICLITAGLYTS